MLTGFGRSGASLAVIRRFNKSVWVRHGADAAMQLTGA